MVRKALALEGGSLRCMFTAGAVDVMMERGLEFEGVFGVSAGALTGINYVSRQVGRTARVNLEFVNDKRYLGVRNLILHHSLFNFDFMFGEVSDTLIPLDRKTIRENPCQFTAIATDCLTGQPRFFEKSATPDIYAAIRASASMPMLSPMVQVEGTPCLDGGVSLSIPYERPLEEGYGKVVVVTTREHGYRKPGVSPTMGRLYARAYRKYPQLVRALMNVPYRYGKELDELDRLEAHGEVFVLRPPKPVTVSRAEKDTKKLQALYEEGRAACLAQWEALAAYLKG